MLISYSDDNKAKRGRWWCNARASVWMCAILFCSATFFSSIAHAEGVPYEVEIEAPNDIEKLLRDNLELIRWRGNARMDESQLQRLYRGTPDEIRRLVETEGYYSPEIDPRMEKRGEKTHIVFRVALGQPVLVHDVDLVFEGALASQMPDVKPDRNELRKGWLLPPGSVFRQREWEAAKATLLRQVTQVRYPRAKILDTQATVDPDTRHVALKVVIDSGDPARFGAVRIDGLKRYPESVVLRENQIKAGEEFSEPALRAWQSRLQDSGYFRNVEVAADLEQESAEVPVKVTVSEYQRKRIGLGAGYSTNTGNRVQFAFDDLYLFGNELKLNSAITLENLRQTMSGTVLLPVIQEGYRDSVGALYQRTDIEGEVTRLASLNAKRTWGTPNLERSVTLEYLNEENTIEGYGTNYSQALPLTYSVILRKLDSRLAPTRGYAVQAQVGAAVEPVLTDNSFLRTYLRGVNYHPLGAKGELILRGELGAITSSGKEGIPTTLLFRAGGDQSVRGYAYQSLGVRRGDAITGGRYLTTASAEYQYWFLPKWGAAVFVDAGDAADSLANLDPAVGYGVGGRWRSPVGPISVDVAYGRRTQEYRLHFSLGFSF